MERTRQDNLRMKLPKCVFGKKEVSVLGHHVSFGKIRPETEHQSAIEKFQEPRNGTERLRHRGVRNVFGELLEDGARRMAPL